MAPNSKSVFTSMLEAPERCRPSDAIAVPYQALALSTVSGTGARTDSRWLFPWPFLRPLSVLCVVIGHVHHAKGKSPSRVQVSAAPWAVAREALSPGARHQGRPRWWRGHAHRFRRGACCAGPTALCPISCVTAKMDIIHLVSTVRVQGIEY